MSLKYSQNSGFFLEFSRARSDFEASLLQFSLVFLSSKWLRVEFSGPRHDFETSFLKPSGLEVTSSRVFSSQVTSKWLRAEFHRAVSTSKCAGTYLEPSALEFSRPRSGFDWVFTSVLDLEMTSIRVLSSALDDDMPSNELFSTSKLLRAEFSSAC